MGGLVMLPGKRNRGTNVFSNGKYGDKSAKSVREDHRCAGKTMLRISRAQTGYKELDVVKRGKSCRRQVTLCTPRC